MIHFKYDNFQVNQRGDLCINQNGYSFIMFTSDDCQYCFEIFPSFVRLSQTIKGCVFGTVNVNADNQKIVTLSTLSNTPLEYVPYFILYANGVPIAQYHSDEAQPDSNFEKMKLFLVAQTQNQQQQQLKNQSGANSNFVIPEYSFGIPYNSGTNTSKSKRVCYLNYSSAYADQKQ